MNASARIRGVQASHTATPGNASVPPSVGVGVDEKKDGTPPGIEKVAKNIGSGRRERAIVACQCTQDR